MKRSFPFFSHTEWISKGKTGVPVELGLKVCIVEDTDGYLLHHQLMQQHSDDQIAIDLIVQTQARYPALRDCSFDKGFHSPTNQIELAKKLGDELQQKIRNQEKRKRRRDPLAAWPAATLNDVR